MVLRQAVRYGKPTADATYNLFSPNNIRHADDVPVFRGAIHVGTGAGQLRDAGLDRPFAGNNLLEGPKQFLTGHFFDDRAVDSLLKRRIFCPRFGLK